MDSSILLKKGISIERLYLFCEILHAGGIRAAVGEDPAKQSLASRQMRELSDYVGGALWKRNGRSLEFTETGKKLAQISTEFFNRFESFLRETQGLPETFYLGIGDSIFQWFILPHMKKFKARFPHTELIPCSYQTSQILRKTNARELDAGIVRTSAIPRGQFITEPVGEIKYNLFIPKELYKNRGRGNLNQFIKDLPFCNLTGRGEYARTMRKFITAFHGQCVLNCFSMIQMYSAVRTGQYVAVLPERSKIGFNADETLHFILPELSAFTRPITMIYKKEVTANPSKKSVLDFIVALMK